MSYTMDEKYVLIKKHLLEQKSTNPIEIAKSLMHFDFVNIHGPEHHLVDGGAFLVAYFNAGGNINLESSIEELANRTIKMPGAMCGLWGVCGAVSSVGAALSVIHGSGPLSSDDFYKQHMEFTSLVLNKMSKIGGPRCCKRNAFLSLSTAVDFVEEKYGIKMEKEDIVCEFSSLNAQCILERCPFHK